MPYSAIPTLTDEVVSLLIIGDDGGLDDLEASVLRALPTAIIDRAKTASEARSWMARGSYHMIMTASVLEDGEGVGLLQEARQSQSDAVRVLLGDELASDVVADAINTGQVYRILPSPYPYSLVERCLRNGLDWRQHGLAMRVLLTEQREVHLALASSLSALERTQRQMVHVERLATVGRLTSGIIHEVRNQLTGLMGVFEAIRYEGGEGSEAAKGGYEVVKRLVARISSIESFARGGGWSYEMEDVTAGELLDQLQALYRLEVGEPGLLVAALPEVREALFHVDAGKLVHAVLSVIREGHDRFETSVKLRATLRSDDALQLICQASGSHPKPRVRRPGSEDTTNPLRTVVQMIVEAHGGRITDLDPDTQREYVRITVPCAAVRSSQEQPA